ncbi:MAG: DUF4136 domain-containing protein [Novosphingobium sp.]
MKLRSTVMLLALLALAGCVAPTGPVQVTRFHTPDVAPLGHGSIAVEPAAGMDGNSLEFRSFAAAVARQLQVVGYDTSGQGNGDQVAQVKLSRSTYRPVRNGSPVSVGLGGSAGSYGSGLGVGIGIDLSGPPPEQVDTELAVSIKDRKTAAVLWEGRASFTVRATSPLADTQLGAAKLAEALFKGFPGNSGETIQVK